MPFDSQGNFTRVMNWTNDYQNDIEIVCDRHDAEDDNFAAGFNDCFCRDGRATATGNFKMGNFKITGLGNGTLSGDAVNKSQLDSISSAVPVLISEAVDSMLSALYPVGSLYIGTQSSCPLSTLISGSTWTLVAENKALWTGDGTNGNTTIAAGLPNITGNLGNLRTNSNSSQGNPVISMSGAFSATDASVYGGDNDGNGRWAAYFDSANFDASRSSSIYGASSTVQPPAYVVNVWRRTA